MQKKTPSNFGNISDAFIKTYGKGNIIKAFKENKGKEYAIYKALLKRDFPRIYRAFGWGGMRNTFNAVIRKLYA